MRFQRVMLINPKYRGHYPAFICVGLGYVAEALAMAGIEHDYFDMSLDNKTKRLNRKISSFSPDLIGIQMMTYSYLNTYQLISKIKKMFPEVSIVVGGHHISTVREDVLIENKDVDYGIFMEGEETLLELCLGEVRLSEIKGLIYRKDGKIILTGERPFIEDLDSLPLPKYERFELQRYPSPTIPITSSRGCPYSCIMCPICLTSGKIIRLRSAKNVVEEIEYWYQQGNRRFGFTDDNFTFNKERVYEICDEIEHRNLTDLQLVCGNGIRADKADRQLLRRMKQVGFNWIAIGVEAGNNRILKKIKKGENLETIEEAIRNACDLGYDVVLFFLIGSPGETEADIRESMALALRYPVASVEFYNLIAFPGTKLFEWVEENDYFVRLPKEYLNDASHWINEPVFQTKELSLEARRKMFRECQKVTSKVKKAYIKKKLAQYSFLADIFATIYITKFFQKRVLSSTKLKKIIRRLYSIMVKENWY